MLVREWFELWAVYALFLNKAFWSGLILAVCINKELKSFKKWQNIILQD